MADICFDVENKEGEVIELEVSLNDLFICRREVRFDGSKAKKVIYEECAVRKIILDDEGWSLYLYSSITHNHFTKSLDSYDKTLWATGEEGFEEKDNYYKFVEE